MDGTNRTVPSEDQIKRRARERAVDVLSGSAVFQGMNLSDQQRIYLSLVDEFAGKEIEKHGLSKPMATDSGKEMGYKGYDPGFQGDTRAFKELVDSVDFPKFVADLLKAVFDANLKVMKQQTDTYIKLMKEATKSSAEFIKKVKDDESFKAGTGVRRDLGIELVEDVYFSTPLAPCEAGGDLLSSATEVSLPADRLDRNNTRVQLFSFKSADRKSPAFSRAVRLPGAVHLPARAPSDYAASFSVLAGHAMTSYHSARRIPCRPAALARPTSMDDLIGSVLRIASPLVQELLKGASLRGGAATAAPGADAPATGILGQGRPAARRCGGELMDEAFLPLQQMLEGLASFPGAIEDSEAGVRSYIHAFEIESPVELDVFRDEDGTLRIGSIPPLYRVDTSLRPSYHRLRLAASLLRSSDGS